MCLCACAVALPLAAPGGPTESRRSHLQPSSSPTNPTPRLSWAQKETLSTNYAENRLVMDPNIDHRSNKKGHRIRRKEEREEGAAEPAQGEAAETFSDDDGGWRVCGMWWSGEGMGCPG